QDPESVHARFDVKEWPHLAIYEHDVAKIFADPDRTFDVARWVKESAVRIELAILDNQRNLVRSARNADRVGLSAGVELVAEDVASSESSKHVEPSGSETVIVEPESRSRILWQLVGVMDSLCIARAEPVRGNCRVAAAISRDKSTVQMRHQAHLITERCEPRINWNPVGVGFRKIMRIADIKRRSRLCHYSHPQPTPPCRGTP